MSTFSYPIVQGALRSQVAASIAVAAAILLPSCNGNKLEAAKGAFELFGIAFDRLAPEALPESESK